jgi:hypothetical protein
VLQPADGEDAATGGVAFTFVGKATNTEQLAFSAVRSRDGQTVRGEYEWREATPTGEAVVHGSVNCLTVSGNSARVSGPVTHVTTRGSDAPPTTEGADLVFFAEDFGECQHIKDLASRPQPGRCDLAIAGGTSPVVDGNLQVHDADLVGLSEGEPW